MKALAITLAVVLSSILSCEPDDVTCQECYIEYYELNKDTQEFEYQGEYECTVDQIGIIRYSSDGLKMAKYLGREIDCDE